MTTTHRKTSWTGVEFIVGLDIETSGALVGVNHIVAVGVAVVHLRSARVVEVKRWTADLEDIVWERRCLTEFWEKHPEVLPKLKADTPRERRLSQHHLGANVVAWLNAAREIYRGLVVVSDFTQFDAGWINHAAAATECLPLYLDNCGKFRRVLDTDAYKEALEDAGLSIAVDMSDTPPASHLPEVDATFIAVEFARLLAQLGFL